MYTRKQFLALLDEMVKAFDYEKVMILTNAYEFRYEDDPICRLIYKPEDKEIIVSFHVHTTSYSSIIIFSSISKLFGELKLTKEYYVDVKDRLHVGEYAYEIAMQELLSNDPTLIFESEEENEEVDKEKAIEKFLRDKSTKPKKGDFWN